MLSITYHLTMMVLKLKGIKRAFSQSPVDVTKLRKEDIHMPFHKLLHGCATATLRFSQTTVTELVSANAPSSDYLIIYCPGGAYVYGPTELNWNYIGHIANRTRTKAWIVDYPKAPETNIEEISANIDLVYEEALKSYSPSNIILMGDSVGGSLMLSLVQRLIKTGEPVPSKIIAISPVLDASMTNPEIAKIDKVDPILSRNGVLSAKEMCAGHIDLKDPIISPLYGSFNGFPPTHFFVAENDIMMPDQKVAIQKMREENVDLEVIEGKEMPHIWPLLPVMSEAKTALSKVEDIIENTVHKEIKLYDSVPA